MDTTKSKLELFYPIYPMVITQGFGENAVPFYKKMGMLGHNGIDFWALTNTPIRAAHDGVVTFAGEDGSAGLGIVIRTNMPFEYNASSAYFKTIYWHLKSFAVKANTPVLAGDIIGYADNTGMSTGSHLHFGIKPVAQGEQDWAWYNIEQNNGYFGAINPTPYWNRLYAKDAQTILSILNQQISLLTKVVELYRLMIK